MGRLLVRIGPCCASDSICNVVSPNSADVKKKVMSGFPGIHFGVYRGFRRSVNKEDLKSQIFSMKI